MPFTRFFCASSDPSRNEMRQACFDYLSFGGVFTNGPIALLSGVNPHPLSLVVHFFAAAVFGVGCLLLPFPSPKRMLIGARLNSVSLVLETSIYTLPGPMISIILSIMMNTAFFFLMISCFLHFPGCIKHYFPRYKG